jgi:chemotaxis protein methyltransferase CheR
MQPLHDTTFQALSTLMHGAIGVHFPPAKKPLVASRLAPRIQKLGLDGYDDYLQLITGPAATAPPVASSRWRSTC